MLHFIKYDFIQVSHVKNGFTLSISPPTLGGVRGGLNQRRCTLLFRPPLSPPNSGGENNGLIFMQEYNMKKLIFMN